MSAPGDHHAYLQRNDYVLPEGVTFTHEESALLRRYGHWMEALASGRLEPATLEQHHFVEAARGEADPRTDFERAWAKLSQTREPAGSRFKRLIEARARAQFLQQEKEAERNRVLERVKDDLDAIDARYAAELDEAARELEQAEAVVRAEVLLVGKSVKYGPLHAVYYAGRITWDNEALARLAERTPEILDHRKVGAPNVQLRFPKPQE